MEIIIDLIVITFILLCVCFGYKKGLVNLGIRMLSFLVAIIITFVLYRPVSMIIINCTQIDESIENVIVEKFDKEKTANEEGQDINFIENTKNNILVSVAKPLSHNIIYAIVMALLFIISQIILFFISSLSEIVTKLPVINQLNKAGGILYGIILAFFIIYLVLLIISFIAKLNPNSEVEQLIQSTYVTKLLYEYNIFNIFIFN